MNSIAHMIAGVCFLVLAVAVLFLGLLEGSLIAGFVGAVFMVVIAWALFKKSETLGIEETIGRRLFKGNFN